MNNYVKFTLIALILTPALCAMEKKTPLHKAAADCKTFIYPTISQDKSALIKKDGDGNLPLHEAAAFGCKNNAKDLLEAGLEYLWGSPYAISEDLAKLNDPKMKLNALDYSSYVNAQNKNGETPLDKAHYFHKSELEKLLKAYGGRYNIYKELNTKLSQQALDELLNKSKSTFQEIIALQSGANPNAKDSKGKTRLHWLALMADYKTPYLPFEALLAYGADINALDNEGYTPYGRAAQNASGQEGDYITSFFKKRNAKYQTGCPKQEQPRRYRQ